MRQTTRSAIFTLPVALFLTGCAIKPPIAKSEQFKIGGIDVLSTSAEQQLALFHAPENVVKGCLAPQPDAVATFGEKVSLGIKGTSIGESESDGAAVLGGRGPAALIARDLLFRACELSLNYKLSKDEALQLYRETLISIEKVTSTRSRSGSASLSATPFPASKDDDDDDEDD